MDAPKDFFIKDGELICYLGDAANIVIPESANNIGMGVFIENKNVRSAILPNSLTCIGKCAFAFGHNTPHIKEVRVPYGSVAMRYAVKARLKVVTFPCCESRVHGI